MEAKNNLSIEQTLFTTDTSLIMISVYLNTLGLKAVKNQSNKSPLSKLDSSDPTPPPSGHAKYVSLLRSVETLATNARKSFSVVHCCFGKANSNALMQ